MTKQDCCQSKKNISYIKYNNIIYRLSFRAVSRDDVVMAFQ